MARYIKYRANSLAHQTFYAPFPKLILFPNDYFVYKNTEDVYFLFTALYPFSVVVTVFTRAKTF